MTVETVLVWFRDDLRVHDHGPLTTALAEADRVVPVYVFDPRQYERLDIGVKKTGPRRAEFRRESVADLRESLRERGGDLVVRRGRPEEEVPELASDHGATTVYCQTKPATEEQSVEEGVRAELDEVDLHTCWDHTLYHPADLPTAPPNIADTFTPWRESVEDTAAVRSPDPAPETVPTPAVDAGEIPSLAALGFEDPNVDHDERGAYAFEGGESAGLARLEEYVWERDCLREYKETRNGLVGADYSSKFSPWLAHGCLSPRRIQAAVDRYEDERVANESTYWLTFELMWRDFFQFQFSRHGAQFFKPGGIRERDIDWREDEGAFQRWADGETGVPFVDAAMRELNATGYISNRARQNAASFLANDLRVDWRWGAAYFESRLVDYDVCSNWGNWAYIAGTGNDSRDRSFDVLWQAYRYDPEGKYVRHWLPELDDLPPRYVHEPWRLDEREGESVDLQVGIDYPRPMCDLNEPSNRPT